MLGFIVKIALIAAVALGAAPQRPQISEVFDAKVSVSKHAAGRSAIGEGTWTIDQPGGRGSQLWHFTTPEDFYFEMLEDYPKGRVFLSDKRTCRIQEVSGQMPSLWGWLESAHYEGQHKYEHGTFDVWAHQVAHTKFELGVPVGEINRPGIFRRVSHDDTLQISFFSFETSFINKTRLEIPRPCRDQIAEN